MNDQWFDDWFPIIAMMLQVILWGQIVPRIASPKMVALLTFQHYIGDPQW